jgi:hypothetical protein
MLVYFQALWGNVSPKLLNNSFFSHPQPTRFLFDVVGRTLHNRNKLENLYTEFLGELKKQDRLMLGNERFECSTPFSVEEMRIEECVEEVEVSKLQMNIFKVERTSWFVAASS